MGDIFDTTMNKRKFNQSDEALKTLFDTKFTALRTVLLITNSSCAQDVNITGI